MAIKSRLLAAATSLTAMACANGTGAPPAPAVPPAPAAPPSPAGPAARGLATVDDAVQAARADAARRKGVALSAFDIVSAERVTWSDGGLGCPQPGMMYTMALVPGYRVRLRLQDEVLDYHAGQRGALVLCPAGQSVDPVPGGAM